MKVLRLTPHFYFPPNIAPIWKVHLDQIGGMQTQIYRLASALSNKGIKQTILTIGMKEAPKKWVLDDNVEIISANIPIIPIKSKIRGTYGLNIYWGIGVVIWIIKYLIKSLFVKVNKFDTIHSHCSGVASPLIVGVIAKYLLRKPLVYTVHCSRIGTYEPMSKFDRYINKLVIYMEKKCLSKADKIIVLTERTKSLIIERYKSMNPDVILVIPDIISFEKFSKKVTDEKVKSFITKFGIPQDKKIVTFVGRVAHEKGWKYFIESIKFIKERNIHFLICGDGNERSDMEKMVDSLNVRDRVTITGFIANDLVAIGLHISDMVVMPSIHEEFGSLILEVACMKKPLIASRVGGIPVNIIDGERGLLVSPRSAEEIASKIEYLIENEEVGKKIGENLYHFANEAYDEQIIISKYELCYK